MHDRTSSKVGRVSRDGGPGDAQRLARAPDKRERCLRAATVTPTQ